MADGYTRGLRFRREGASGDYAFQTVEGRGASDEIVCEIALLAPGRWTARADPVSIAAEFEVRPFSAAQVSSQTPERSALRI